MPAFKHDGKARPVRIQREAGGRDNGHRGIAERLGTPAQCEPARGGDAHADAGETARAAIDQDARSPAAFGELGDHGHQPFGMAAADYLMPRADHRPILDQCDRAGGGGRFDDEGPGRFRQSC